MATTPASEPRLHALDAVRAGALLLGIVLHATMSFFLPVPAQDVSRSATLAAGFHVIHSFRMSLFFLLAGFFAHLLFHRRGARAFVRERAKRIVVPMTVGWLVLAPLTIAIVILGVSRTFPEGTPAGVDRAAATPDGFPLIHLWFLYYLCLFCGLALALRAVVVATVYRDGALRARVDALVRAMMSSRLAPLAFGAPLCLVLVADPTWAPWFGIQTPDHGLMPQLPAMVGFGTAFGLGWLLHRQVDLLALWRARWMSNLVLAILLSATCLVIAGPAPSADATALAGPPGTRIAYALAYTASIWCWIAGLVGAAQRWCAREHRVLRYLSDASYWMYLAHLPIVFGLQVLVMDWPLHWTLKFPLVVAVTLAVLFASYHVLVRTTIIGEILNGRRVARRRHDDAPTHAPDAGRVVAEVRAFGRDGRANEAGVADAPVAELVDVHKRYGGSIALDGLSLAVRPGELLAVLGPNGAGKSTAIGLWLGTLQPDAGTVRLMGGSPFDVQCRLGIGVMMQDVNLAPMLSAREHLALATACYRDPLSVAEAVALAGIEAFANQRYGRLSGGQKRQVQFALAVCGRPRLLFLDEPTVGLDVQAREALWRALRALLGQGRSIVLTTHYLEEAEALADRVAVLANGRLVAQGSVEAMRALVVRRQIRCASTLDVERIRRWPGVVDAERRERLVHVTASDAESVVRRWFEADPALGQLEVRQASLADALAELSREAA